MAFSKKAKDYNRKVEKCDQDLIKPEIKKKRALKILVRKVYIEKKEFFWGLEQKKAFNAIKNIMINNAVVVANPDLQFHLIVDANINAIEKVLF